MMGNTSLANSTDSSYNCQPRPKLIDDYGEFIIIIITYGFTFFAGFIGNAIIIYIVFYFRKMKSVPNMFLANLAFADLLLILFCVPIKCAQLFSFTWQFGLVLCKLIHYIQNLSVINSVYTLTAISIERYFAILHPLKNLTACTEDKTKWIIVSIWLLSFTIAAPTLFFRTHYPVACGQYYCMLNYDNPLTKYFTLYQATLILVIPTIILCYTYAAICSKLWYVLSSNRRSQLTGVTAETSQYDPNLTEIEEQTCLDQELTTNQNIKKINFVDNPLTTSTNLNKTEFTNDTKIKLNTSINQTHSSSKLTLKLNSSSLDSKNTCSPFKKNLIKPEMKSVTIDNQLNLKLKSNDEDMNNNSDVENKSSLNQKTNQTDQDKQLKIEMKTFRSQTKGTNYESDGSYSPEQVTLQANIVQKNGNTKKMLSFNRNSIKQLQRSTSEKSNDNTAKQIIKMLVIVILIFIFSWSPILIFNLCRGFSIIPRFNQGYLKEINTVASLLSYINSCVNPFVYGLCSRNFRSSFKQVFRQFFSCSLKPAHSNRNRSINTKNQTLSVCH